MRWLALVTAGLLSGCSFVFVSGPPANHAQLPSFSCTESRVAPVLDTIFTVLQGANFIFAATASDQRWAENFDGDPPLERGTAIPLYAAATLLGIGGAYYGFSRTSACREARARMMYGPQNFGQPQTWPPPQGPYAPQQGPYAPPQQGPYAPPAQQPYPPAPPPAYPPPAQQLYPLAPAPTPAPAPPPPPNAAPPPPAE